VLPFAVVAEQQTNDPGSGAIGHLDVTEHNVLAGDALLVWLSYDDGSGATIAVTDSVNPAPYALVRTIHNVPDGQFMAAFLKKNSLASPEPAGIVVSADWSAPTVATAMWLEVVRGASVDPVPTSAQSAGNVQNTPTTAPNAVTSTPATPSSVNALVVGLAFHNASSEVPAPSAGFTAGITGWDVGAIYGNLAAKSESKIVASASPVAATWTAGANNSHMSMVVIFEQAPQYGYGFMLAV
jgi:hypothetical protein